MGYLQSGIIFQSVCGRQHECVHRFYVCAKSYCEHNVYHPHHLTRTRDVWDLSKVVEYIILNEPKDK